MRLRTIAYILFAAMLTLAIAACDVEDDDDTPVADPDPVVETDDDGVEPDDDADEPATEDDTAEVEPTPEPEPTPTPEPEPEPTATPEPEPETPDVGTRDNPIPMGESALVGDWEIRVVEVTRDATQSVLDENMFNDPPEEGHQFFMARINAVYHGDDSETFWIGMRLRAVDDGGVVYEGMDSYCGVIPDSLSDRGEAFPGAEIEGNDCWAVSSEHVNSMLMIAEPSFSFSDNRVFFALHE